MAGFTAIGPRGIAVQASVPRFWGCEFWAGAHYLLPNRIVLFYSEPLTLRYDPRRIATPK